MSDTRAAQLPEITVSRLLRSQCRTILAGRTVALCGISLFAVALGSGIYSALIVTDAASVGTTRDLHSTSFALMLPVGEFVAMVLGADVLAGEHSRGLMAANLIVVPRRGLYFVTRLVALGFTLTILGLMAAALNGITALGLASIVGSSLPDRGAMSSWGATVFIFAAGIGILGIACASAGSLIRRLPSTIIVLFIVLYVAPSALAFFPEGGLSSAIRSYLPGQLLRTAVDSSVEDTAGGFALLALAVATLVVAAVAARIFSSRDLASGIQRRSRQRSRFSRRVQIIKRREAGVTLWRAVAAERHKALSLPSIRVLVAVVTMAEIAMSVVRPFLSSPYDVGGDLSFAVEVELAYAATGALQFVTILVAAAVVTYVAGEFETGTAVPSAIALGRRGLLVSARIVMVVSGALALAVVSVGLALLGAAVVYAVQGYGIALAVGVVAMWSLPTSALYLALVAVLSAGLAGLARRSGPAMLFAFVLFFAGPLVLNEISAVAAPDGGVLSLVGNLGRFLPGDAVYSPQSLGDLGQPLLRYRADGILQASPVFSMIVLASWAAAALAAWYPASRRVIHAP